MKTLRNEQGVALVTALMMTLISLAVIMAVLYLVTQGTQLTASQKRYKTALESSHGGVEVFTKELIPKLFDNYSTSKLINDFSQINLAIANSNCLKQKLSLPTASWGSVCGTAAKTLDAKTSPDATFKLSGLINQPGFNVSTKIVDTTPGNSDQSGFELLDSGTGVTGSNAGVAPKHIPAIYRIEVEAEREQSCREKALLSVLYAY